MKSSHLIKHVTTLISICLWLAIAFLVFTVGSYFYSFSGNFVGASLKIDNNYSLTHDEVDQLINMGLPLTDSRSYIIRDGKKEVLQFEDDKSRYFINNHFLVAPNSWQRFLMILSSIVNISILTYGIFLLRKFLINTKNRGPFLRENVLHIRRIVYLIFFYIFLSWLYNGTIIGLIKNSFNKSQGIPFTIDFNTQIILAFLVLILAAIFEYGVTLKEESELTI